MHPNGLYKISGSNKPKLWLINEPFLFYFFRAMANCVAKPVISVKFKYRLKIN